MKAVAHRQSFAILKLVSNGTKKGSTSTVSNVVCIIYVSGEKNTTEPTVRAFKYLTLTRTAYSCLSE